MKKYNWDQHEELIAELLAKGYTQTKVAKHITGKKKGDKEFESLRKWVARHMKRIMDEFKGMDDVQDVMDVPMENVAMFWHKTDKYSALIKNPDFKPATVEEAEAQEIDFAAIFKDVKPVDYDVRQGMGEINSAFDRLVYTDVHIGMDVTGGSGNRKYTESMYGGQWDEDELDERLSSMITFVLSQKQSDTLHIQELGDLMDGWNGITTRGGHGLPQNMTNQKAYDVALKFKIKMINSLAVHYKHIHCHNICMDNHAGAFGYVVNSAFKTVVEMMYPEAVTVTNQTKFIDHYTIKTSDIDFTFVLTHGKDDKHLKFGFKPQMDDKQEKKIMNYLQENYLIQPDSNIFFVKGDSHRYLMDRSTSDHFDYENFPAFSPSSQWIQHNFQKGRSGFVMFNHHISGHIFEKPHFFGWKK